VEAQLFTFTESAKVSSRLSTEVTLSILIFFARKNLLIKKLEARLVDQLGLLLSLFNFRASSLDYDDF